jgi:hypothetical protein
MNRKQTKRDEVLKQAIEALESRQMLSTTWTPANGAAFQTALNSAQLGDTIILNAGTTYSQAGGFTLKNKTTGSGWITIQSSNLASLPGAGVRVTPADAVNMPKLQTLGGNASVIYTDTSAHHYKMIGLDFDGPASTPSVPDPHLTALLSLGTDVATQSTIASEPHHLVLDRCYMHPDTPDRSVRRAVALNSMYTDITNCWIADIHEAGSDSQAIGGYNGSGHYNIINNHLEGASENIMFGGATTRVPIEPTDIVIRGNEVIKPLKWMNAGYNTKNLFELKQGKNVLVEGNIGGEKQ